MSPVRIPERVRGADGLRIYRVWASMIQRCTNANSRHYRNYGGKGVTVCDRWRWSFEAFVADMGIPAVGMSIERVDNNGNYEPANCKWILRGDQNRNRSWCRYVRVNDERVTLKDAWRAVSPADVTYRSFVKRLGRGWSLGEALVAPC